MTAPTQLRPYQERALHETRSALARGVRRVLAYMPTGGGKTVSAEAMIRGAVAKGKRVLLTANRKQLVAQASAHLTRAGIAHGILQGENTRHLHAPVLVCSIDTIAVRGIPDDVGLLIIDEAHAVAGSKKFRDLLFRYNRVPVIGLSATPFSPGMGKHYDELRGALFEELVIGATIRELVELGNLVDVECYAPADPDLSGVRTQRGIGGELDYSETQLAEAVDKPQLIGDIVQHWFKLARGKQTVVFATSIAHSQHIVTEFVRAGIAAAHIDYHFDDDERAAVLDRFARGETMILANVGLLAEGWDCPATECMILARPTKSLIRYIQMVGRVLRPHPGKERAVLLDHSGTVLRLGFATDELPLELDDGKANASTRKKEERKPSEPKACPSCKFVRPAGVHACPSCGFAPQRLNDVEIADGELVKIDRKVKKPATPDRKQHVYSQLLHICRKKGHKPGWTANQYKKMFGVWPRGLRDVTATPTPEIEGWLKSQRIAYLKSREKAQEGRANV
ncbi:DEAD/DEAH box helicase [Aromatoleum aromaticum]|uniref:DEAD/DEAH box helicase n=1 Tax=Aromatoleum aromaticum TaxID=551760 RepID=UPI001459C27B|nr:DEAD/DEAH box helicase [Aromatoleum aromaticum]NMG55305.1 DEAD/DEAH box helicase [Aromatoleum aromaticum]